MNYFFNSQKSKLDILELSCEHIHSVNLLDLDLFHDSLYNYK